jgi:hypothetical protein
MVPRGCMTSYGSGRASVVPASQVEDASPRSQGKPERRTGARCPLCVRFAVSPTSNANAEPDAVVSIGDLDEACACGTDHDADAVVSVGDRDRACVLVDKLPSGPGSLWSGVLGCHFDPCDGAAVVAMLGGVAANRSRDDQQQAEDNCSGNNGDCAGVPAPGRGGDAHPTSLLCRGASAPSVGRTGLASIREWSRFGLTPGGIPFRQVIDAARNRRDRAAHHAAPHLTEIQARTADLHEAQEDASIARPHDRLDPLTTAESTVRVERGAGIDPPEL